MERFENNQATEYIYGSLFCLDFEKEGLPGKEDMEKQNTVTNFVEYVCSHARRCGYTGDINDISKLAAFLAGKCKDAQVKISRQTLVNWLTKGMPSNTESGRENVYRLCFALQMNCRQTAEFFLKAYLERPFNYKEIHEAVYFFCMNNGLTYSDAVRIISTIECCDVVENPYADDITEQIGARLAGIKTEEELVRYLIKNRSGFNVQNLSATNKIEELIESCYEIAPKEYALTYPYAKDITVGNIDELLSVIYGYNARAKEDGIDLYKKTISKSNFPKLIKQNWPDRERFQQIFDKTASYDVIRRALIMLLFYDYFANATVKEKEAEERRRKTGKVEDIPCVADGLFDDFEIEANTVLSECGYVQLYWRNPYDWMIGYCAMSHDPLRTLRDLIGEYYLSVPSVIDE